MYVSKSHVVWIIELIMSMYHTLIHARGASHLWLIYMNAFNWSSLVLLRKRCKGLPAWFSCQIRYACATHPRLLDLQFSNRNKVHFQFTGYQNSFRMTISLGLKTRMKSFWIDLYGNKMSFWYHVHVNKYRDIMEMEWTCSKMKVTLVPCELPVRGGYYKRVKLNYYPFPKRWKIRLERGGLAL